MPVQVDEATFDALVGQALDGIPDALAALVDNVVVLVDDEPPPDGPVLLGLYEGVPATEPESWTAGQLPDRILVFRGPLTRMCDSIEQLVEQVRVTVVHEVAHHFGLDDARLAELGYG